MRPMFVVEYYICYLLYYITMTLCFYEESSGGIGHATVLYSLYVAGLYKGAVI